MTSTTFFIIFIPILAIILLAVNLILAPHNPYQEKDSPFECGFHSFSGQNRTQFSISFFIFALLFLLFDLEIVLIYPYSVSGYNNGIYGLAIMIVFFLVLTGGFIFELGKNALSIDSRQTSTYENEEIPESHVYIEFPSEKIRFSGFWGKPKLTPEEIEGLNKSILDLQGELVFTLPQLVPLLDGLDKFIKESSVEVVFKDGKIEINPKDKPVDGLYEIRKKILTDIRLISVKLHQVNDILSEALGKEKILLDDNPKYQSKLDDEKNIIFFFELLFRKIISSSE